MGQNIGAILFCLFFLKMQAQIYHPTSGSPESGSFSIPPGYAYITDPPAMPVRAMAEWEEIAQLLLTYDLTGFSDHRKKLVREIARYAQEEAEVIVYCSGAFIFDVVARVRAEFSAHGIPLDRIRFEKADFDSRIWIRDFGPHTIYANEVDSMMLVDWKYENQFLAADTQVSHALAAYLTTSLYSTDAQPNFFKLDGGNFFTDGLGLGMSSSHVLEENQLSEQTIDLIVKEYMGIQEYVKFPKLEYDVIHHLDMHMKLLDESTILVAAYPEGTADGPRIDSNLHWFLNHYKTSFGKEFRVHRIPMPPDEYGHYPDVRNHCSAGLGMGCYYNYTNALFINKTILVPLFFDSTGMDLEALAIWSALKPGHRIVGIDCKEIIREYGAIHCVTKEVGVKDPLWIIHEPIVQSCPDEPYLEVLARAKHRSGMGKMMIHYRMDTLKPFQTYEMVPLDNDWYLSYLPSGEAGQNIYYYLEGFSKSGKQITRPLPGAKGAWTVAVNCQTSSTEFTQNRRSGKLELFPNPCQSNFRFIASSRESNHQAILEIRDMSGLVRKRMPFTRSMNPSRELHGRVSVHDLKPGVYQVFIFCGSQVLSERLIIF